MGWLASEQTSRPACTLTPNGIQNMSTLTSGRHKTTTMHLTGQERSERSWVLGGRSGGAAAGLRGEEPTQTTTDMHPAGERKRWLIMTETKEKWMRMRERRKTKQGLKAHIKPISVYQHLFSGKCTERETGKTVYRCTILVRAHPTRLSHVRTPAASDPRAFF